MASQYTKVVRFTGVYYSESKVNKFRGRADRTYWVNFRDTETGKLRWEKCGKASDGWTPEAAQRKRHEILEQDRVGEYKPKGERKKNLITFGQFMVQHYFVWAKVNKKHPRDDYSRYNSWIKNEFEDTPLSKVGAKDIQALLSKMREAGRSEATAKQVYALIRHVFNKAIEWGIWDGVNPCRLIKIPKLNNARQRFLSKDEAQFLLDALKEHSLQISQIAELSLYSGMRLGEIFSLKWKDIDVEHGVFAILDTKNKESRHGFITEPIGRVLKDLLPGSPDDLLFKSRHGEPVAFLSKTFGIVVKKLGLNEGISDRRQRVSFHTLRHTFASWAIMNGVPLYHVAKALGHKTTAMTERYSHLAPESQRMAYSAVANFGGE